MDAPPLNTWTLKADRMSKGITIEDVPADVWEVWAIRMVGQPIGMTTWNRCNEIIKRYPEWFEWEHKYDKIPKEAHEAYQREAHPERYEPIKLGTEEGFVGIIPSLSPPQPEPERSLKEVFAMLFKQQQEARELKDAENKKAKAIWDKHYSKYGLEYRE